MTENEFIHIVPQLRQIALQISQGYGVGCDEAEDIAQDAMLKLWAIKEDIQSAAHAKGSMGCIAKHLCIDFFRKRKMISIFLISCNICFLALDSNTDTDSVVIPTICAISSELFFSTCRR